MEQVNRTYLLEVLDMLLQTPSPSGYTHHIMDKVKAEAEKLGYKLELTNKGCGIITIPGKRSDYTIGLSAHVDTLGAMVRSIKDNGRLRLTSVGGFMMAAIENEYCRVHTRQGLSYEGTILTTKPSVHVFPDARDHKRVEENMEVRLDELAFNKEEVQKLGIRVGDFVSFEPRVRMLENGYVKSRHLDDKASVAALFALLDLLKNELIEPACTVKIILTTYEEVGHGASYIPADIDELLAVDMGAMGDDLTCTEQDVSICAKDSSGPYDYAMTSQLIRLAEHSGIRHVVDVYPQYGSDASAALRGGSNIRAALIGPGVHASHGMERTHVDAIAGTASLLLQYILHPAAAASDPGQPENPVSPV
ncbi:aminopeptidase [Paenibacillus chitinolyticus]|uniref:Aminopeptidase n=1 Tax=Paenibacillus chitinolyticus TaxID=79263 RepID=A0A410WW69_9BACL|nr:M42 family metallopeptidase [Paenibacillus chitinolyticus]MCY9592793.1 M42 family metallopeptidase [Paenibacillus chitinolyticus]MCY9597605.1 M42 family metallopeptidase [Paenibacillus chitinolyticus]QAV18594.1 aminopeptidase [Paenibacillus chitinolyticus]